MNEIIQKYLGSDLAASAAGYPGAQDDLTTYIRAEMIESGHSSPEIEELVRREHGDNE